MKTEHNIIERITAVHPAEMSKPMEVVIDFEICCGSGELRQVLMEINRSKYRFAGITQDGDMYTVLFWRPKNG